MILVMMLVVMPSVLLVGVTTDTKQMVSLVALFLGLLTFVEYNATYPSLVEFRDAPPFNRIRFLMLFATVFFLSTIERGKIMPSTLTEFTDAVLDKGCKLSMDGRGAWRDNVFVERLWRTVKYEEVYLKCYVSMVDAHAQLDRFFRFYNERRPHSSLDDATPRETYRATIPIAVNQ